MKVPVAAVDCISLGRLPSQFAQYVIPHSAYDIEKTLPSHSTSKTTLVRLKIGRLLVFKSTDDSPEVYYSQIVSLFSIRSYFLSPVQGFTATQPFGFFYSYCEEEKPLRDYILNDQAFPAIAKTLVAAFVCYGMAYLEVNQILHGTLHSENIFITRDFIPIITDCGLARTYDLFEPDRNDGLSWIAPELLLGVHPNYSIDMYSFGVLLFEMHEKRRPFNNLSNRELLIGLRYQKLKQFDFDKTPEEWRVLIRRCIDPDPDMRPSFCEVFHLFLQGSFVFPGASVEHVKHVLSKYPIAQLFTQDDTPTKSARPASIAPVPARPHKPMEILMDSRNPKFGDVTARVASSVAEADAGRFCDILARHCTPSTDPAIVEILLVAVRTIVARGAPFFDAAVRSPFFTKLYVRSRGEADVLAELLKPLFFDSSASFRPALFQSVAGLFVYRPAETLNLFAHYFTKPDVKKMPSFDDSAQFFLGLWSLALNSSLGARYISLIRFLVAEDPDFYSGHAREVLGVLLAFLSSSSTAAAIAAGAVLVRLWPDGLVFMADEFVAMAQDEQDRAGFELIFLAMRDIPNSPALVDLLIPRAAASPDDKTWLLLIKYARQSEAHALTIAKSKGWLPARFQAFDRPLRLLLCVFAYPALRGELAQNPETFVFVKKLCILDQEESLHIVCSLLQRVPKDEALVGVMSQTGLLQTYLSATLESSNPACVKLGIVVVDLFARVGYADEWVGAVHVFIGFLRDKFDAFGSEVVRVISTLSPFPRCMAVMRDTGLIDYYKDLLQYPTFAEFARFLLSNAARDQ
jgi:hypothetical protein